MELSISAALKQIGESFPFSMNGVFPGQEYGGREISFISPFSVEGTYGFDGKSVTVRCDVSVILRSVCARCGEMFDEPLRYTMDELFIKNLDEDTDTDAYSFSGDILCLDDAILDNLFLTLPIVSICKPDCKGICPVCGTNRNICDCGCVVPDPKNPFTVLQSIIRNDD